MHSVPPALKFIIFPIDMLRAPAIHRRRGLGFRALVLLIILAIIGYLMLRSGTDDAPAQTPIQRPPYSFAARRETSTTLIGASEMTTAPPGISEETLETLPTTTIEGTLAMSASASTAEPSSKSKTIPIVILTYNRPDYLRQTIDALNAAHVPPGWSFPRIFCQDGDDAKQAAFIKKELLGPPEAGNHFFQNMPRPIFKPGTRWLFHEHPPEKGKGYFFLAHNFKFSMKQVFDVFEHETAIFLEDDVEIGADFLELCASQKERLVTDPTVFCVCGYSENGIDGAVRESKRLHRTGYFPGWGWMITREVWLEWKQNGWPLAFWDDWVRAPEQRRGRDCIYPQVSRTRHFGRSGTSGGMFFEVIQFVHLNKEPVSWLEEDFGYLDRNRYIDELRKSVDSAKLLSEIPPTSFQGFKGDPQVESYKIRYGNEQSFLRIAKWINIIPPFKLGKPRNSILGVVELHFPSGHRLYLVPSKGMEKE